VSAPACWKTLALSGAEGEISMNAKKGFVAIALALGVASGSLGCAHKGVMEKAGEKVDKAVDDVTHPNEGPLGKAGRKVDETVDDAKEKL
jgi:hypothetical protein